MKKSILFTFLAANFFGNAQVGIEPFAPLVPGTYIGNFNIPVLTDIVVAMPYTDEGDITTNDFVSDDGLTIFGYAVGAVGNYCAAGVDAGEDMTLVSPVMDFGANTLNPTLTFRWGQGRDFGGFPNGYGTQYFEVLYKESLAGPWVVATTITTLDPTDIWHTEVVDLSGASNYSTFYIGFRVFCTAPGAFVSYGKTVWDEIVVTGEPACSASTGAATIAMCDTYTVPSGDETYTSSGIVKDTLPSATGCDSIITINLTINISPSISLGSFSTDTLCNPGTIISLPSASPVGGTFSGAGVIGSNFNPILVPFGVNYVVYSFTDGNGCSDIDSVSIVIENCLGISEFDESQFVSIYPNPAINNFTIDFLNTRDELKVDIYSAEGSLVYSNLIYNSIQQIINVENWNKGIYFINITNGNSVQSKKLIKQ